MCSCLRPDESHVRAVFLALFSTISTERVMVDWLLGAIWPVDEDGWTRYFASRYFVTSQACTDRIALDQKSGSVPHHAINLLGCIY